MAERDNSVEHCGLTELNRRTELKKLVSRHKHLLQRSEQEGASVEPYVRITRDMDAPSHLIVSYLEKFGRHLEPTCAFHGDADEICSPPDACGRA